MLYTTISRERLRGAFGLDVSGSANHRKGCIKLCRTTDFFFFFPDGLAGPSRYRSSVTKTLGRRSEPLVGGCSVSVK